MSARDRLLSILIERSFRTGKVVLASGKTSDFYIDCRQTALHAEGSALIGELLFEHIQALRADGLTIDGVGGMTLGADPLATAASLVSFQKGAPAHAFIVRKESKDHGTGKMVEGLRNLPEGSQVLVLEDTVTTGGSTIKAVERIKAAGLRPVAIVSIVDRDEGGASALAEVGLPYASLYSRKDFPIRAE